jgi:hypothetical protein
MIVMYPRSKNLKDGWSDSLSNIEKEFDKERAGRALLTVSRMAHKLGLSTKELTHIVAEATKV